MNKRGTKRSKKSKKSKKKKRGAIKGLDEPVVNDHGGRCAKKRIAVMV